jgi:hypothetical protein
VNDATWFALGVVATLLSALIAHKNGRITIDWQRRAHQLNVKLASPAIGSRCTLETTIIVPASLNIPEFVLKITLDNAGNLPATKLKGNCAITCSQSAYNQTIPITLDTLGDKSYQLETQFSGNVITQAIRSGQVSINVDIQFEFLGLDNKTPEKYSAHYEYSHEHRNMIRK